MSPFGMVFRIGFRFHWGPTRVSLGWIVTVAVPMFAPATLAAIMIVSALSLTLSSVTSSVTVTSCLPAANVSSVEASV